MRAFTAVIESCPETGLFVGYVPGFPGVHSQGETLEELNRNLAEVIEMLLEDGEPRLESRFVGTQTVEVAECAEASGGVAGAGGWHGSYSEGHPAVCRGDLFDSSAWVDFNDGRPRSDWPAERPGFVVAGPWLLKGPEMRPRSVVYGLLFALGAAGCDDAPRPDVAATKPETPKPAPAPPSRRPAKPRVRGIFPEELHLWKDPEPAPKPPPDEAPRAVPARPAASFPGSRPGEIWTVRVGPVPVDFAWCPPGTFRMGSPPNEPRRRETMEEQVDVTIDPGFWMMTTEVSQRLFRQVMGWNRSWFEGDDRPMERVSYAAAAKCAELLTARLRRLGELPPGWEVRLPTEAQWEYAARAGTTTATPFGASLSSTQANFNGTMYYNGAPVGPSLRETRPVGSYPPNAWGIHDTAGNVAEWTSDVPRDRLPGGKNPHWVGGEPETRMHRVIRGGSWGSDGENCRSAARGSIGIRFPSSGIGFRLAVVRSDVTTPDRIPSEEERFRGIEAGAPTDPGG